MEARVRDPVPAGTVVLTLVSLALVFGAVLGAIPTESIPRAPAAVLEAIPHVNAVVSTTAIGTILAGWRAIRRGRVSRHRALMLTSLGLFVSFLGLYLYRVMLRGPTAFQGPDVLYRFVYLPTLAIHMLLAILCIPLLYYVLLLALTRTVDDLRRSRHAAIGRVAASLWLVSFVLGNVVYALLYLVF